VSGHGLALQDFLEGTMKMAWIGSNLGKLDLAVPLDKLKAFLPGYAMRP
jgi:hypothetical protein